MDMNCVGSGQEIVSLGPCGSFIKSNEHMEQLSNKCLCNNV